MMITKSFVKTICALLAASGANAYYLRVEAAGTELHNQWVVAQDGITSADGTLYSVFSFSSNLSKAFLGFNSVGEFTFGPSNVAIGFDWYAFNTDSGAVQLEIKDGFLESYIDFYACKGENDPAILEKNWAWYGSVDPSRINNTTTIGPSDSTESSPEISPTDTGPSDTTDTGPSDNTDTGPSDTTDTGPFVSPTDTGPIVSPIVPPTDTEPVVSLIPPVSIASPEPPTVSPGTIVDGNSALLPASSLQLGAPLVERDNLDPLPTHIPYPVDFGSCISIRLKAEESTGEKCENCTLPVVPPISCTGTACCRTICTTSCVKSGTGCAAPTCSTVCPGSTPSGPTGPSTGPNITPTPTPDRPCPTCTPVQCTKCLDPNVWIVPGCSTCVRTVTNFVYTCPSLTTITVRTCPTVNKCGTTVITAPPGELTISGLAVIDAKETFTTKLLTTKAGTTGQGTTSRTLGTATSLTGGSGGAITLANLMLGVISVITFFW